MKFNTAALGEPERRTKTPAVSPKSRSKGRGPSANSPTRTNVIGFNDAQAARIEKHLGTPYMSSFYSMVMGLKISGYNHETMSGLMEHMTGPEIANKSVWSALLPMIRGTKDPARAYWAYRAGFGPSEIEVVSDMTVDALRTIATMRSL